MRWVQFCSNLNILWHALSLGLEWKRTFSSPVSTADVSKFAGILSAAFWTVVLEKTLESPLDCKEIQPVHPKGNQSFLSFCLFILFMGFSWQEYWSGLPFSSPVDHVLSELSTITCPSWVALHDKAHSSFELDKAVVHVISLISFLWLCLIDFHSAFPLMNKDKRLMAVSW